MIRKFEGFRNELYLIIKKTSSGRTSIREQIMYEPVSPKSPAASVLLRKSLEEKEFEDVIDLISISEYDLKKIIRTPDSVGYKKISKFLLAINNLRFLKQKAQEGELFCEYCGKGPMVIYDFNPDEFTTKNLMDSNYRFNTKFNPEDGATTDHRNPKSKGGDKYEKSNLAVSCYICNREKDNMEYYQWLEIVKNRNPDQWEKLNKANLHESI
jgi:hypothetical protein